MKTIKHLEDDLILAKEINNQEWITQLESKLEDREEMLGLIIKMQQEGCSEVIDAKELKKRITE